jgi:diguanylate cyclase (GGDEF)-like protein
MVASIALPVVVVVGARGPHRVTAALSLSGLTGLVLALDYPADPRAVLLAGLLMVAGAAPLRTRVRRAVGPLGSGYPLLALLLAAAGLATWYHLLQVHRFDRVSVALALAGVLLAALREALAAIDLRRYATRTAAEGAYLRALVRGSSEVALVLDERLVVRWQSPASARLFGLSDQEVVGRPVVDLVHPADADRLAALDAGGPFEVRLRDGYGFWRDTEATVSGPDPERPDAPLVVHLRDVGRHKELERTVARSAHTDPLTSLANRHGLRRAPGPLGGAGAVIVLELTGLAGVNEVHGHDLGDAVLVETGRRLRAELGPDDLPARLHGGRFAVLTGVGAVQAHLLASRLLSVLTEPYPAPGAVAHVTARAGLADLSSGYDVDEAVRRAELALRAAPAGTGAVEWYEEAMEEALLRRAAIGQELPGALARGELDLAFQPIVELGDLRPVGAEALLRWRSPRLGNVTPAELIPAAEELDLLDDIGQWALHVACRQLSAWHRDGYRPWISLNATVGQLAGARFMAAVTTALDTHLVEPSGLVIEVSEPGLAEAARADAFEQVVDHLAQLRAAGVRTAIGNFGTGPTSLGQLRVLPLDLLKIDREVFAAAPRAGRPDVIMDALVKLSSRLGIQVIAQGLESDEDLATARAAGCHFAQGYLLGRPVPAERLEAILSRS